MLFNSTEFLVFLAVVLLGFYFLRGHLGLRNLFLLVASYFFYGWWSIGFLLVMIATTCVDYAIGRAMAFGFPSRKKAFLAGSLLMNLGVLVYFKYQRFFWETISAFLESFGYTPLSPLQEVVLPVGISFYTFQSISFVVDVYRGRVIPPQKLSEYLAYVAFFPQLVAGPIERSSHLLPQFERGTVQTAHDADEGLWLILWGLFKKVVIADNLGGFVDLVYADASTATAPLIAAATFAFGLQIYGDFSGYSDVARGVGKLFGFDIMFNFRIPYSSQSIQEFWTRWHISLSSWFKDYLYIPLGGNRLGLPRTLINLLIVMVLAGLWHGAAVTFVLWGFAHGIALAIHRLWSAGPGRGVRVPGAVAWLLTMLVVFAAWLLFRAPSAADLHLLFAGLLEWSTPSWVGNFLWGIFFYTFILVAVEFWLWRSRDLLAPVRLPAWPKAAVQAAMILVLAAHWDKEAAPFIYFQF